MPNTEALGRRFNVVPIAAGRGLSIRGVGGWTFVCTGSDTFTITAATSFSGSYSSPGNIITKKYTSSATNGSAAWVEASQSASNAVTGTNTVAFFVGEDMLPDGYTYVKVSVGGSGLVTAIATDLDAQRTPANLPIPSA